MTELWTLAEKIGDVSGPVLIVLALIGGYKRWWVWGYQLSECEARATALLVAAERRENEWKELALSGAITAKAAVETLKDDRGHRKIGRLPAGE